MPSSLTGLPSGAENLFQADAVGGTDVAAVGDGVAALDQLPGIVLGVAVLGLLRGVPADGGGVEEDLRACRAREAGALGEPLVPADQHADLGRRRVSQARKPVSPGVK